jgi:hypothetical protein
MTGTPTMITPASMIIARLRIHRGILAIMRHM